MSYIGNTSTTQSFTPAIDYFSGNASTTAFILSRPVASVAQVQVTIDNVAQNPSTAFTVSGNTLTFTSAPLSGTNNIYVYYTSPITQVIAPSAGTVGSSQLASLSTIPTTGGNITIPAVTGTMMVSGNMPAFSAYPSGNQSISTSTWTKLQYNTEEFDTNSNYDNATNYRFQPTIAGYYSFTAGALSLNVVTRVILAFYKNGTIFKAFDVAYALNSLSGASLIYLNGSTDYVELYAYMVGTTPTIATSSVYSFFQASMIRGA